MTPSLKNSNLNYESPSHSPSRLPQESKNRIIIIISVLLSGVAAACLVVFLMVYSQVNAPKYTIKNVLLAPETLQTLSPQSQSSLSNRSEKNNPSLFVLKKIEFTYYDQQKGRWMTKPIDLERYKAFFQLIENEKSLKISEISGQEVGITQQPPSSTEVLDLLFRDPSIARLLLYLEGNVSSPNQPSYQKNNSPISSSNAFQEVHFTPKYDYFRVELHDDSSNAEWAYFSYPNIYQKVLELFLEE